MSAISSLFLLSFWVVHHFAHSKNLPNWRNKRILTLGHHGVARKFKYKMGQRLPRKPFETRRPITFDPQSSTSMGFTQISARFSYWYIYCFQCGQPDGRAIDSSSFYMQITTVFMRIAIWIHSMCVLTNTHVKIVTHVHRYVHLYMHKYAQTSFFHIGRG